MGEAKPEFGNPGDLAFGIEIQFHCGNFGPRSFAFAEALPEGQFEFVAPLSDGIEFLKAETDGVDQGVAAGASLAGGVHGHAVAVRHGLGFGDRGQIGVDARRRIGHVLAEELFANEEPARGGRGLVRLGGQGKEERLPEEPRTFGGGGKGTRSKSLAGGSTP